MIQPTSNYLGFNRAGAINDAAQNHAPAPSTTAVATDRLSSDNTQALRNALASSPEVRPDVVERGKQMLVDGNYPPRAIIEDIAKLFLSSKDPSETA